MKKKTGQSILEYTLLLAAIIGIIVLVVFRKDGIKTTTEDVYNKSADVINASLTELRSQGIFNTTPSE